jgi:uncharacterized protein YjaG (DUF416 family)
MGLCAIPALEHILIDRSLLGFWFHPSKNHRALEYKLIDIPLLSDRPSDINTDYRHSRKAWDVRRNPMAIRELDTLLSLQESKIFTFAYLASERVYPYYRHFSTSNNFGSPSVLKGAIEIIRESIFVSSVDLKKIDHLLVEVERNIPHTANFSDPFATIAMYSGGVIYESVNLLNSQDMKRKVYDISTMITDAIDVYIQVRDNMEYSLPDFEQIIQNDPLMIGETRIQKGVISYLKNIDNLTLEDLSTLVQLQDADKVILKPL